MTPKIWLQSTREKTCKVSLENLDKIASVALGQEALKCRSLVSGALGELRVLLGGMPCPGMLCSGRVSL